MMIVFCTILFIWLMMMFSADKSDPLEATRNKKDPATNTSRQSRHARNNFNIYSPTPTNQHENTDLDESKQSTFDTSSGQCEQERELTTELQEMTNENYEHFVRRLPSGVRTILLIVNEVNKELLTHKFGQVARQFGNK